jgi:hypothetical protein
MRIVAYIDAGSGSYLLAAIASGAVGAWFFLHAQIAKLRRKITGKSKEVIVHQADLDDLAAAELAEAEAQELEAQSAESVQASENPPSLDK